MTLESKYGHYHAHTISFNIVHLLKLEAKSIERRSRVVRDMHVKAYKCSAIRRMNIFKVSETAVNNDTILYKPFLSLYNNLYK